jgi:hypothetical protein
MSKYTARVRVSFTVEYDLAIPTDNPNPSDSDILDKIRGKELFTEFGWSASTGSNARLGLNEMALAEEGIEVEDYNYYSDPSPTGRQTFRREWEMEIEENEEEEEAS